MALSDVLSNRIEETIGSNRVVLFMKGTPAQPQCGFSASVIEVLNHLTPDYATIDVLTDPEIREGIKEFSNWPTIPQLYVSGQLVGGCDIVKQMFNTGELHALVGATPPERTAPQIKISDQAAAAIKSALEQQPAVAVHLQISATWNHQFKLGPAQGHEIKADSNGVEILFDLSSAQRANGLTIDMAETAHGTGFNIHNPNAPPPIKQISPNELKNMLLAPGKIHLFDVREPGERAKACIEESRLLDKDAVDFIERLPKDEAMVFYCHTGRRSQSAADYFRERGYTSVHNLSGGIDAWSQRVDPDVPRY